MCELAELSPTTEGVPIPSPLCSGSSPWPSAGSKCVGSFEASFVVLSPGPLTHPPTLRGARRRAPRKQWTSRGWTPLGVGLDRHSSFSPTSSRRFSSAQRIGSGCSTYRSDDRKKPSTLLSLRDLGVYSRAHFGRTPEECRHVPTFPLRKNYELPVRVRIPAAAVSRASQLFRIGDTSP